jgi:hypothetical protein
MEASQTRDLCVAKSATLRAARLGPSRDKKRLAQDDKRMSFEQATIKVEKPQQFAALQAAVEEAFLPENAERFLKQLEHKGIRIRDFDGVLSARALEAVAGKAKADVSAWQLYQALSLTDQAQMRELYLSKLEGVDTGLRHKFKKLYQYY